MKKRLFVSVLVLAILLCGVVAYAKVTTTPNGYTIDFTYDKYRASSSSMYGAYCEAYATLTPAKANWYVRASLVGPLGNTISDSGRVYRYSVSSSNYAVSPTVDKYYPDVHARGNWEESIKGLSKRRITN